MAMPLPPCENPSWISSRYCSQALVDGLRLGAVIMTDSAPESVITSLAGFGDFRGEGSSKKQRSRRTRLRFLESRAPEMKVAKRLYRIARDRMTIADSEKNYGRLATGV
jgi:hypothetical protein